MAGIHQANAGSRGPASRNIDDIAQAQGITAPQDVTKIFGAAADLWDSDREFEGFVAGIQQRREEGREADARKQREELGA